MSEEERSQIEFIAPSKWQELKSGMRTACSSMGDFRLRVIEGDNEFIVERFKGDLVHKRLLLEFDPLIAVI